MGGVLNIFKRRKYTMKFKKKYHYVDWGAWSEVTDYYLLSVLLELQEEYDFEIVSTKFKNCFNFSRIKIKCNKEDKLKIFMTYYLRLGNDIEKFSF